MSNTHEIKVPDIGDFESVEVIEVLVKAGSQICAEDSLITVESDKASMEIPAPCDGIIERVQVKIGDKISQGDTICTLRLSGDTPATNHQPTTTTLHTSNSIKTQLLVLGSGPGGYTCAFRAADLGLSTVLVEQYPVLGGVCLNVGCIPSKALLHNAQIINEAAEMSAHGISFAKPKIDLDKLRAFKNKVIGQLTGGLGGLAKQRKVQLVHGLGKFISQHQLEVSSETDTTIIEFEQCVIAAGSLPTQIPSFPHHDPRIIDSTGALELVDIPKRLLVIGGGIIGLEMATVYDALGSNVSVVELMDGLMPGADRDLVKPFQKFVAKRYENIFTRTRVTKMEAQKQGIKVWFEGDTAPAHDVFDRVLVAVGRQPNGLKIDADKAGVMVDAHGFIPVDRQQRTNVAHIFAIGDIVGQPMLAHKATHEGKVAAEVAAGLKSSFDARTIPSVAYTDPEIAWMGLTETQAKELGTPYEKAVFPWAASGRSLSLGRSEGLTKILYEPETLQVLGAGIVGPNAGELIAEAVLALEMNAELQDLALTIHPHPTLSETLNFAAEIGEGTITDLYIPKKRK